MVHHLLFEGIYMNSDIWVNGTHLANHFYGYTPVEIDLTPYLKPDADNVVAVQVKTDSVTARWYSGSGIYRHVRLLSRRPVHLKTDGTSITSSITAADNATVSITSEIANPEGENLRHNSRRLSHGCESPAVVARHPCSLHSGDIRQR